MAALHDWAANRNIFNASHSYGVHALVTKPELLATINEAQSAYIAVWDALSASW